MARFVAVLRREMLLTLRSPGQVMALLVFFIIAASLFPLGIGADAPLLRRVAPGILWVSALFAALLGLPRLFDGDYQDGTLEQMALARDAFPAVVLGKILAHWLTSGLPLAVVAPLIALQFDLDGASLGLLLAALIPGTLLMSLIGAVGAALTLGLRGGGVLLPVLVLPLYVPVLIFGAGSLEAGLSGLDPAPHLFLLAALLALALFFAPWGAAVSLRIALE